MEHLELLPSGAYRIRTGLFITRTGLSLEDGALTEPEGTAQRCKKQPCGVLAIPKATLAVGGVVAEPDRLGDAEYREEHLNVVDRLSKGVARQLRDASVVVVAHPEVVVVNGAGPTAAAPPA